MKPLQLKIIYLGEIEARNVRSCLLVTMLIVTVVIAGIANRVPEDVCNLYMKVVRTLAST